MMAVKESKPSIKIKFTDFWPDFDLPNFMIYQLLLEKYDVIISEEPDLLFYSVYGNKHSSFTGTKIFFTADNIRPDFKVCDFAFTFDYHSNKRNYRLPLYAFYGDVTSLLNKKKDAKEILRSKKKFCCFIVSNPASVIRNNFFIELSKYKQVDSGGSLYNNIGGIVENKRAFIKDYKFVIAFENSAYPGYVTEKIFEPFLEDCIPIYWADPLIEKDFNTKSFINCRDFSSFDEVIKHVIQIDEDDGKYIDYLNQPAFPKNKLNEFVKKERILSRLDEIILFNNNRSKAFIKFQKIRPLYCILNNQLKKIKSRITKKIL